MGDPHRKDRYGETWPQHRVDALRSDLTRLRDLVIVSGGWAWCLMSPPGHIEYKHAHDMKDVDLFVEGRDVTALYGRLAELGHVRVSTRYDKRLDTPYEFHRYERVAEPDGHEPFRVTIDLFVGEPPVRELEGGWRVVCPRHLITLYKTVHGSDKCFAVQAATRLLVQGIDPVGRPELCEPPAD